MSSHRIRGRQLSRDTEHRKSLRRSLAQSLFEHGKIRTTIAKAKEVKSFIEKLLTLAKDAATAGDDVDGKRRALAARRRVIAYMNDRRLVDEDQEFTGQTVVQKLFSDIAPKFVDRPGGYTRIIKLAKHRIGDGGDLVQLELALDETTEKPKGTIRRSAGLRRKRNEKRHQFAARAMKKGDKVEAGAAAAETKAE
ncbi:MAG TPA: 50S ribosomal protein L17 [Tepidisphaeraceae bacterium]|nr:50S ribosomal protein L17 [Tepidisphaeraceae bacterium]